MNSYQQELTKREEAGLLRTLPPNPESVDFYSNDYLGFSRSEQLYQDIETEYRSLPQKRTGSTGSRLLSGNSQYAELLETEIAKTHATDSALLFSSGYNANVGMLSALGKKGVTFISDELIHASMIDGVRLSHADRRKFKHNDLTDLELQLSKVAGDKIVLVESIYSMDGDVAPLKPILKLCEKYGAELVVDEAHAIGVTGQNGEGLCSSLGIQHEVLATVVTYGKAMGTHGAAVLGAKWLTDYLVNFARSFVYSTAPSTHQLASIQCAYRWNSKASVERRRLEKIIDYFISRRKKLDQLKWLNSDTAIQSLIIPGNDNVLGAASMLRKSGMSILPIRSPSVPVGSERLRISLHAYNTSDEIDLLFDTIEKWEQEK